MSAAASPSEPPTRPMRASWAAMHGTPVRAVLDLDRKALERPLVAHLVARCTECGVVGVEVYDRTSGAVCALCDHRPPCRAASRCPECDTPLVPASTPQGLRGLEWVRDCGCIS